MKLVFDSGGFNIAGMTAVLNPAALRRRWHQHRSRRSHPRRNHRRRNHRRRNHRRRSRPAPLPVPTTYTSPTDRIPRPKPALPAIGGAGSIFADPAFGSKMLRVTDANTRPGSTGVSFRTPSAGPQIAWDMASKYFYVTSTDGTILVYSFDASTMTATRVPGTGDGGLQLNFYVEPQFSSTKPGVIYGIYAGGDLRTVYQYDLAAGTYTPVLDLDTVVPGISGYVGSMMTGGTPTEYLMTFFGGGSQDQHYLLLWSPIGNLGARKVINTLASTINGVATNIPLNFKLHAATIDRSGRYVFLHPTAVDLAAPAVRAAGVHLGHDHRRHHADHERRQRRRSECAARRPRGSRLRSRRQSRLLHELGVGRRAVAVPIAGHAAGHARHDQSAPDAERGVSERSHDLGERAAQHPRADHQPPRIATPPRRTRRPGARGTTRSSRSRRTRRQGDDDRVAFRASPKQHRQRQHTRTIRTSGTSRGRASRLTATG